jgi:hypothetical protein
MQSEPASDVTRANLPLTKREPANTLEYLPPAKVAKDGDRPQYGQTELPGTTGEGSARSDRTTGRDTGRQVADSHQVHDACHGGTVGNDGQSSRRPRTCGAYWCKACKYEFRFGIQPDDFEKSDPCRNCLFGTDEGDYTHLHTVWQRARYAGDKRLGVQGRQFVLAELAQVLAAAKPELMAYLEYTKRSSVVFTIEIHMEILSAASGQMFAKTFTDEFSVRDSRRIWSEQLDRLLTPSDDIMQEFSAFCQPYEVLTLSKLSFVQGESNWMEGWLKR